MSGGPDMDRGHGFKLADIARYILEGSVSGIPGIAQMYRMLSNHDIA